MEHNNENMGMDIAMLAHDLKSPITTIKGYLFALKDGVLPDSIRDDFIDIAIGEADRMLRMLENLQSSCSQFIVSPVKFCGYKLCSDILQAYCEKFAATNISSSVNCLYDGDVFADEALIRRVIINLVDNAIQHGMGISFIRIDIFKRDGKVHFAIANDGKAIPHDIAEYIWDKNFTTGSNTGNSGLGLHIVKSILDAHGEKIFLASSDCIKTVFEFTLPEG